MNASNANIHPNAKIGSNVTIEPFATIGDNVEVGDGSWIGPNAVIMSGSRIGKNCRIYPGAVIGSIPQDLKFEGENTLAVIGDNTTVREYVTVNRGTKANNETKVGNNCLLMAYVHVAHDCIISNNCILANGVTLAGHIEIDDYAIIGGLSAIHQFVKIGKHVIISGGSLVNKDVPPFTKAARDPLSYAGVNSIGLKRRGFETETINNIQEYYRVVYQSGMNNSQAVEMVTEQFPQSPERDEIIAFIRDSERGIMKGYASTKNENRLREYL
ncbi:MAG: acyl-ACP--UDP-N-acetylglucosamine O-acyltransferase [Flavobacteriales bacterium]|nr:acyl-ACP--UDP-N-acetylglucosamine O-acyltransferase [Flavobacteriales bacterium]